MSEMAPEIAVPEDYKLGYTTGREDGFTRGLALALEHVERVRGRWETLRDDSGPLFARVGDAGVKALDQALDAVRAELSK